MKELKLIDRVVVEIKGEGNEELKLSDVAYELRYIADQIEDGICSGDEEESSKEYMWEYECKRYGGFRMGDKSLIGMHYYGSEKKPKAISGELMDGIIEFNKDYDEQYEKIGEDIYTKTAFLEDAARLLSRVEQENK